jgi:hypothetical protein
MKRPRGRPAKYPFPTMKVGDSFVVPSVSYIWGSITYWQNKLNHVYTTATIRDGLRVERVG